MEIQPSVFAKIIDSIHDGLYIVNRNRIITCWNRSAERITGFSAEEVLGRSCADTLLTPIDSEGNSLCTAVCPLTKTMIDGTMRKSKVYLHHKNGQRIPVSLRVTTLTDPNGLMVGGIELFTDLSKQADAEQRLKELEEMALLDKLTKLANRSYLEREFESRFDEYVRYKVPFGIFFIDIDHFKIFNDTHGHKMGETVLKFVAKTFSANSRSFDLYGRWDGEEFIGIIRNITPGHLQKLGNRMRVLVEHAYIIHEEKKLHVTLSMGATLVRKDDTMDSLVKRADTLLHQSKAQGGNRMTYR